MSTQQNGQMLTKVVFLARLSYANLWTPQVQKDDKGNDKEVYGVTALIPKDPNAMPDIPAKVRAELIAVNAIPKIGMAVQEAIRSSLATKFNNKQPQQIPNFKFPVKDGDLIADEKPEYKGMIYIGCNSSTPPGLLDEFKRKVTDGVTLYSGCWAYLSVNFYGFKNKSTGIACGLNNAMKFADDTNFGGRAAAEFDFADIKVSEAAKDAINDPMAGFGLGIPGF